MVNLFTDALIDSLAMVPFLLIIYLGIEFVEFRFGAAIREKVVGARKAGPILGAVFGVVPQCGFSVISTALYARRLISLGTLLAVYLSTSDEAIPVILAQPDKAGIIIPLLTAKILIALTAGYGIDLIMPGKARSEAREEVCAAEDEACGAVLSEEAVHADEGCCGHNLAVEKPNYREMIWHPAVHTAKVFVFVFAASMFINILLFQLGDAGLARIFLGDSILQPVLVALVGLIPNCAASVAITEIFMKGAISFGSAVAGLSASAGLGILVLIRENRDTRDTLRVIGLLYAVSVLAGIFIQYIYG